MKRVHTTPDELESIAWHTGRPVEFTATEAFCRVGATEYHTELTAIAERALEVTA